MSFSGTKSPPFIEQSGVVTPGHLLAWTTDGVAQDAGSPNAPFATTLGLVSNSLVSFGIDSAPVTGAFNQLGLGFDSVTGNAALSVSAFNGAPGVGFEIIVNGVTYPFPGVGNGDVSGPGSSTDGDVALFNGSTGKLLKDGGNGRITGSLSIGTGAFGSGNVNAAVILSDFLDLRNGNEGYQFLRFPSGDIIQAFTGVNTTGEDFIVFPVAFPTACNVVLANEGAPGGWNIAGFISPTTFGTQQLFNNEFALYVTRWEIDNAWHFVGGITYRYIAMGY